MIRVSKLVSEISKEYKLDPRMVNDILRSPFLFTAKVMADDEDDRAIRLPFWGVYNLKPRFRKDGQD